MITALVPVGPHHPVFLRRAIGSLLAQTREDWRGLVVVEREVRHAVTAAVGAALTDARIELVENEGRGLPGALNTGMRAARSEFVAILLGDDLWAPDAVAVLADRIGANPAADFLHSGRVFVDADDRPISSLYRPSEDVSPASFAARAPVKHLLCWRRQLGLAAGGMDERLRHHGPDDLDFPWTMADRGARFVAVPEPLYLYRDHRDGHRLTTHVPRSVQERELRTILRKHGMSRAAARRRVRAARRTYLRQSLYRSRLDRWVRRLIGAVPRDGWRETYR